MRNEVTVRPLTEADIELAAAIVGRNYSKEDEKNAQVEMAAMFGNSPIRPAYLVAECSGTVLGVAGFIQSWMDYHVYNIFWVNVDPDHQRKGIGKRLVGSVIERITSETGRGTPYSILLTSTSPDYYATHFGFKVLDTLGPKKNSLMGLRLV